MTIKLKPDVTLPELAVLVKAMLKLEGSRSNLFVARGNPDFHYMIRFCESLVCEDLDALWEAQQRAA